MSDKIPDAWGIKLAMGPVRFLCDLCGGYDGEYPGGGSPDGTRSNHSAFHFCANAGQDGETHVDICDKCWGSAVKFLRDKNKIDAVVKAAKKEIKDQDHDDTCSMHWELYEAVKALEEP